MIDFVGETFEEEVRVLPDVEEAAVYKAIAGFVGRKFDANVEVYREDEGPIDPADRAGETVPFRSAIHIK